MAKKDILAIDESGGFVNKYVIGQTGAMHIHVKKELKAETKSRADAKKIILNEFVAELIEKSFKEFKRTAKHPDKMTDDEKKAMSKRYAYNIEDELKHDKDLKKPDDRLIKIIHLYVVPEFQAEIKSVAARYSIKMNAFLANMLIDGIKTFDAENKQAKEAERAKKLEAKAKDNKQRDEKKTTREATTNP